MPFVDNSGKLQVTWGDIRYALDHLTQVLKYNQVRPELVVGLARGGAIPAVMLSHRLDVPVQFLSVSSYKGEGQDKLRVNLPFPPKSLDVNMFEYMGALATEWDRESTLIVDDLWDTGQTMEHMGMMFPRALRATLFYKAEELDPRKPPINFPGLKLEPRWAIFPWELGGVGNARVDEPGVDLGKQGVKWGGKR